MFLCQKKKLTEWKKEKKSSTNLCCSGAAEWVRCGAHGPVVCRSLGWLRTSDHLLHPFASRSCSAAPLAFASPWAQEQKGERGEKREELQTSNQNSFLNTMDLNETRAVDSQQLELIDSWKKSRNSEVKLGNQKLHENTSENRRKRKTCWTKRWTQNSLKS